MIRKGEGSTSTKYSCSSLKSLIISQQKPTQQGFAVEYAKMGFSVFPCDLNKVPIVDHSLGFVHGHRDATRDLRVIGKSWHRYPDAGIGLALPEDLIVFDCDIQKDAKNRPVLKDGNPDIIGLRSFQNLILDLNLKDADLHTLSVKTQSGGRHFYYRMPEGISSFNHVKAMEGLDLKGYGGYVVLPNSPGKYGKYEFLNLTEIRPISEALLKWILQFRGTTGGNATIPDQQEVEDARIKEFVSEVLPAWNKAIRGHRGNDFRLAVAGTLYHYGWPEARADRAMKLIIAKSEIPGLSDRNAVHYTYVNGNAGRPIYGFSTLKKLITELEGA
ncbi:MAG: bifunctional DNA primase/polymerase [Candidatus Thermoplasmatota archaeon]|nr:bifunctional DNA primase/polymerase [Candidatus Thermoplasmatota archaeon]